MDEDPATTMGTTTVIDPPPGRAGAAPIVGPTAEPQEAGALLALGAAALLAACGGGEGDAVRQGVPVAMRHPEAATARPELLGRDRPATPEGRQRAQAAARLPTASELMDWAERQFPQLFPSHEANRVLDGTLLYRHYPRSDNYLGVQDGTVLVLGPVSGWQLLSVGTLADFAAQVFASPLAGPTTDAEAARFLLHAQAFATDADIAELRRVGWAAWLDQQLTRAPGPSGWDWLVSRGYSAINEREYFFAEAPCQHMFWQQMMSAPDALRRRWAFALSEIFVVSAAGIGGNTNWPGFATTRFWDLLCEHGFGNYRTLLEAITLNPAMGGFLNTRGNQKEDPASGRVPDENYAREVMQLFSIGLVQLNIDGTPRLGPDGRPLETYTQSDVTHLARVFTGYECDFSGLSGLRSPKPPHPQIWPLPHVQRPMVVDASRHSMLEKRFLGVTIAPGTPAQESLRIALDTLFNHPNVGPFLARQLIQRLVTGNPSGAYVARVAAVFNHNSAGVRGDLGSVLRAILLDEEARGPAGLTSPTFGKLREPALRIAQWGRTFKVRSKAGSWKYAVGNWDPETDLLQHPLNAPSVFNFFRPGYVPSSTAMAAAGATAPEFQLVNESSVAAYINYLEQILFQGIWVRAPELPYFPEQATATDGPDMAPDYSAELALVQDSPALVARLNLLLCANQLSAATQALIVRALDADRPNGYWEPQYLPFHVGRAIMLVMCSADYLVQR
ncbi:MAG: DUF1800 domain-containing protein [Rubrivivax sp.]|nr:DUF1800 domain-containing protein [Rubrivivax sp.]